jgi:hypothetical protein
MSAADSALDLDAFDGEPDSAGSGVVGVVAALHQAPLLETADQP